MSFSNIINLISKGSSVVTLSEDWSQGRAVSSASDLILETEVLRQGKSVSQILGRGIQNGQTLVTIVGSFGHARSSVIHADAGYGVTRAKIANSKGELIAISQQAVTVFA